MFQALIDEFLEFELAKAAEVKSEKQIAMLMSDSSPLSDEEKKKLKGETDSGKIKVRRVQSEGQSY